MIKNLLIGLAALVMSSVAALAQAPGTPTTAIASPTGLEQVEVSNPGPYIAILQGRQLRDAAGYTKQTPATAFTLAFAAGQSQMQIGGAATLATGTITLTAAPVDGQQNCFYTKPVVTALTLQVFAGSGQTLNDAVTATAATTRYCYIYSAGNSSWDRLQ